MVKAVDAGLTAGPASPPGAADLTALSGRVSSLEADQADEDARWAPQPVTFASGFGQFSSAPYGELVRVYKSHTTVVHLEGLCQGSSALAASTSATTMFTLPAGYRPAVQLVRFATYQTGLNAPVPFRLHITTAGLVQVVPHVATSASTWFQFDCKFRTVNT